MYFHLTLFSGLTLLIVALAMGMLAARLWGNRQSKWPAVYYAVLLGYSVALPGSLGPWWVVAGLACTLALQFAPLRGWSLKGVLALEAVFLGYVIVRGAGLLLMWPWW